MESPWKDLDNIPREEELWTEQYTGEVIEKETLICLHSRLHTM
jgi:hypothetical protein